MEEIQVILDTDIGSDIDDALALAYLLSEPRCELLGVTTVTGEAALRAEMASAICRNMGRDDVPIHAGATEALLVDIRQRQAPQAAALGNWPRRRAFPPATAVEFLRRTIRGNPGEVNLLTIGPLTNIALLFAADPEIPSMLAGLYLMCGNFFEAMRGEWNAINDPHATAIVYGAGKQARPPCHVSFGLDVTTKCVLPADECRRRFTAKSLLPVRDFAEIWFQRADRVTFHDPLAAASIFHPEVCKYVRGEVAVPVDGPAAGWTIFRPSDSGPHTVAREVNPAAFFDAYFSTLK